MKPAQSLSIRKEDVVVTTGIFNRNSANALKDAGIICPPGGVKRDHELHGIGCHGDDGGVTPV